MSGVLDSYSYEYDKAQMITGITRNAQAVRFSYDRTYQLTQERGKYTNATAGTVLTLTNRFAYDRAGNRVSMWESSNGGRRKSFRHTSDNQLTGIYWNSSKVTLGGDIQQAWTTLWVRVQQQNTNRTTDATVICHRGQAVAWEVRDLDVIGSGSITFTVTVAAVKSTNSVASPATVIWTNATVVPFSKASSGSGYIKYAYDANGNRTTKTEGTTNTAYTYDVDNQLIHIGATNGGGAMYDYSYEYDPSGRRIKAVEDGTARYFVYDGLDVIAELNSSGTVTKRYVRGNGLGGGIGDIVAEVTPTMTNYFSYNHRGDVVTVTRQDGALTNRYEYDAFGMPLSSIQNPGSSIRATAFSSKEFDTRSGLSYYGFRFYDAQSGRWMTKDPKPSDMPNLYMFVLSNPVNYGDYLGLEVKPYDALSDLYSTIAAAGLVYDELLKSCPSEGTTICVTPSNHGSQTCSYTRCVAQASDIMSKYASAVFFARKVSSWKSITKSSGGRTYIYSGSGAGTEINKRRTASLAPFSQSERPELGLSCGMWSQKMAQVFDDAERPYFIKHEGCFRGLGVLSMGGLHRWFIIIRPTDTAPSYKSTPAAIIDPWQTSGEEIMTTSPWRPTNMDPYVGSVLY